MSQEADQPQPHLLLLFPKNNKKMNDIYTLIKAAQRQDRINRLIAITFIFMNMNWKLGSECRSSVCLFIVY